MTERIDALLERVRPTLLAHASAVEAAATCPPPPPPAAPRRLVLADFDPPEISWPQRLAACSVPPAYADPASPQHVPESLVVPSQIAEWRDAPDRARTLVILGPVGTGKTWIGVHTIVAIAHRGELRANAVLFLDSSLWIAALKRGFDDGGSARLYERAQRAELLLLDDVGAERATEFGAEQLSLLLRDRHLARRLTIITSNASGLEELAGGLDPRIASRLQEGPIVRLSGSDRRRKARS